MINQLSKAAMRLGVVVLLLMASSAALAAAAATPGQSNMQTPPSITGQVG